MSDQLNTTSTNREQPGPRIRRLRMMRNMTQKELAGGQYSTSYISAMERERVRPTASMLKWCAQRLGVPLTSIVGEPGVAADETDAVRMATRQAYEQAHAEMLVTGSEIASGRAEIDEVRRRIGANAPRELHWFAAYGASLDGDAEAALREAEAYQREVEAERDIRGIAAAHWLFGQVYASLDVVRAVAEYQRALDMEEHASFDLDAAMTVRTGLASLLVELGEMSTAAALDAEALREYENLADPAARAAQARTLAEQSAAAGDWLLAYRFIRWAWLSQREATARRAAAQAYLRRALFLADVGDVPPEYELRQALVLADQARDDETRLLAASFLALRCAERGESVDARQVLDLHRLSDASDAGGPSHAAARSVSQLALGWLARAGGDAAAARGCAGAADEALAAATGQSRLILMTAYEALSRLYEALGETALAFRALRRAGALRSRGAGGHRQG